MSRGTRRTSARRSVAPTRTGTAWWRNKRLRFSDVGVRIDEPAAKARAKARRRKADKAAKASRKANR